MLKNLINDRREGGGGKREEENAKEHNFFPPQGRGRIAVGRDLPASPA